MKRLRIPAAVCFVLALFCVCCILAAAQGAAHETIVLDIADGDDLTDAFNRAADQARDNPQGKHFDIVIPPGEYEASGLRLYSHTTVRMEDVVLSHNTDRATMLRFGRASADWEQANGGAGHPGYSGFTDITVSGGVFDGGGYSQAIMRFGHSTGITLRDVTFRNVKNAHMVEMAGCKNVVVDGCVFADFHGSWDATTNYEALQLEVMTTQGSHFGGYHPNNDETPNENVTVQNCVFQNLQRGVGTHTGIAGAYFNNIRITDNEFSNITGFAIIATNYKNAAITGNTIRNCGCGVIFRTMELSHGNVYTSAVSQTRPSTYVQLNSRVADNDISVTPGYRAVFNPIAYGMQLIGEKLSRSDGATPAGDYRLSGVTVSGNTIRVNASGYGIWAYGAAENTIRENKITLTLTEEEMACAGVKLAKCTDNELEQNTVKLKNKAKTAEGTGIQLLDKSTDNVLTDNRISGTPKDGVYLERANGNMLTDNSVSKAGRDAIHIEKSSALEIDGNVLKKPGRNGITANAMKKSNVEENEIAGVQDGIHLEKSKNNTLTGNKIATASRDGILLSTKSNGNTVSGNSIQSTKRHGISIYGSSKTAVQGNRIDAAANYGVFLEGGCTASISGNTITGSGIRARN